MQEQEPKEPTPQELVQAKAAWQNESDKFSAFLADTKERFDKYFSDLGYVCFVFDKSNPENKYLANISNCPMKGFMRKLLPFLGDYRKSLKKLNKNLNKRLRRK